MHEGTSIRFTEAQTANGDWEHYVLYPDVKIVNKIEASFFASLSHHDWSSFLTFFLFRLPTELSI